MLHQIHAVVQNSKYVDDLPGPLAENNHVPTTSSLPGDMQQVDARQDAVTLFDAEDSWPIEQGFQGQRQGFGVNLGLAQAKMLAQSRRKIRQRPAQPSGQVVLSRTASAGLFSMRKQLGKASLQIVRG